MYKNTIIGDATHVLLAYVNCSRKRLSRKLVKKPQLKDSHKAHQRASLGDRILREVNLEKVDCTYLNQSHPLKLWRRFCTSLALVLTIDFSSFSPKSIIQTPTIMMITHKSI